jgi:hypothetical protein
MKKLALLMTLIVTVSLFGCGKGDEVSGRSLRTAYKSVSYIKRRLPADQQIEFEVSFWTIRDSIKDNKELLDKVGGKTADEIIAMGKEIYQQRKNSGAKEYAEFTTWEQMIAKFSQERIDQTRHKKADGKDQANDLMYKL